MTYDRVRLAAEIGRDEGDKLKWYDPRSHTLTAILPGGATVHIDADGGLSLKGDVTVDGDIKSTGTITAATDVIGAGKSLKDHVHMGVQAGGALSGKPQ